MGIRLPSNRYCPPQVLPRQAESGQPAPKLEPQDLHAVTAALPRLFLLSQSCHGRTAVPCASALLRWKELPPQRAAVLPSFGGAMLASTSAVNVLVVEDDAILRDAVTAVLEFGGYAVEAASNVQEALDSVGHAPPRAIVLDMHALIRDGWDV